ncbi:MAG: hypothetical protein R3E31_05400 [Chloroflexota bacterium]
MTMDNRPTHVAIPSKRVERWLFAALILLFFFLILSSAVGDSPTFDEFNHIQPRPGLVADTRSILQ